MTNPKLAFIATGDEITDGDIHNTTGPAIARQLAEYGFTITEHRLIPDDEAAITQAIITLLASNDYLFLTGGLGPTSDDRTRFALAKALKKDLLFDEESWQQVVTRMQRFKLNIPENNRQQALFPNGASILVNAHGTANGCYVTEQNKQIFMLPGPPIECLPMFKQQVLPLLPLQQRHKLTYLLLGVSESDIADIIDTALAGLPCRSGYRADSPYIECKVWADNASALQQCHTVIEPLIREYLVSTDTTIASNRLVAQLSDYQGVIKICDLATYGALQNAISYPQTIKQVQFVEQAGMADILILGLQSFWQDTDDESDILLQFTTSGKQLQHPVRRRRPAQSKTYAVEWLCWQISQWLTQ